jgi:16S rRNA processing protein RimM
MEIRVARVGKPHGVHGQVTIELLTDAPEDRFVPGVVFNLTHPENLTSKYKTLTLKQVNFTNNSYLLDFHEITNRNQAEEIRNQFLSTEVDLTQSSDGEDVFHVQQLIGLKVKLKDGTELGTISDVLNLPGQDCLAIKTAKGERLIPFVYEFVPVVDIENSYIQVELPDGLLDE